MTEYGIGHLAAGAGAGLVLASWLYMLGGRNSKIIRRLGGALVLALTVNLSALALRCWVWELLLLLPTLFAGFSLGYGADTFGGKLLRRSLYAIVVVGSGVLCAFVLGGNAWWVLPFHAGVGAFSIYLGLKNPIHAPAEEFFVSMALNLGLIMYPFLAT